MEDELKEKETCDIFTSLAGHTHCEFVILLPVDDKDCKKIYKRSYI